MEAIDALTRLEDALSGHVNAPDLEAKLDGLIADLEALVGQATDGQHNAVRSHEEAAAELQDESSTRGAGQAARARLCAG